VFTVKGSVVVASGGKLRFWQVGEQTVTARLVFCSLWSVQVALAVLVVTVSSSVVQARSKGSSVVGKSNDMVLSTSIWLKMMSHWPTKNDVSALSLRML